MRREGAAFFGGVGGDDPGAALSRERMAGGGLDVGGEASRESGAGETFVQLIEAGYLGHGIFEVMKADDPFAGVAAHRCGNVVPLLVGEGERTFFLGRVGEAHDDLRHPFRGDGGLSHHGEAHAGFLEEGEGERSGEAVADHGEGASAFTGGDGAREMGDVRDDGACRLGRNGIPDPGAADHFDGGEPFIIAVGGRLPDGVAIEAGEVGTITPALEDEGKVEEIGTESVDRVEQQDGATARSGLPDRVTAVRAGNGDLKF